MADDLVVAERGVLTAPAEAWDLAARQAEVIRRLAGQRVGGWKSPTRLQPSWGCPVAAASAPVLAEVGAVTARGTLGPLLTREPYRPAGDGDPAAYHWKRAQAEASAVIDKARTDPETARRVLAMFTVSCRTLESFNRERDYLIGIGIPAEFLPDAREFGQVAFPDAGPETGYE